MIPKKKMRFRVVGYLRIGRCMFCKKWFSRDYRGVEIMAGKKHEVLCISDAQKLAARYGQTI